jgi:hypothetical protein
MGVFCEEEERFFESSHCFLGIGSPLSSDRGRHFSYPFAYVTRMLFTRHLLYSPESVLHHPHSSPYKYRLAQFLTSTQQASPAKTLHRTVSSPSSTPSL